MTTILEALLSSTGLYVGPQADPEGDDAPVSARVVVAALPGGSGVSFDYDVISPSGGRVHHEHSLLVKTTAGVVMNTSHSHGDVATVMPESEPGYFVATDGTSPFPMAIRLEVPKPGHLVYSWSYGFGDNPMRVRDVGDLRLVQ